MFGINPSGCKTAGADELLSGKWVKGKSAYYTLACYKTSLSEATDVMPGDAGVVPTLEYSE